MALSHVLLTGLLEKPSSGFELARRFDRSMVFFWNASHQQIYRELNQMLNKGWISMLEDDQGRKQKKTYQVEPLGKAELAAWLTQESEPAQLREDLMVRLRAEAQLEQNQILDELNRHVILHQQKLDLYQSIQQRDFNSSLAKDRVQLIHESILKLGIHQEQSWIDWLNQMILDLKQFK